MSELTIVSHSDSEATASAIQHYCTRNKLQQSIVNIKAKIIDRQWQTVVYTRQFLPPK